MRIVLGIGHPADVHFFKNFIAEMKNRGHEVFVAAREKEFTCYLLDKYGIPYHRVSVHRRRAILKIVDYFKRWVRTYRLCKRIRPDMALGVGDFYLPQIGAVLGFRTILISDTESVVHDAFLSFPFADFILTPSCYKKNVKKQIRYDSYNELAYLGRKRFTPDAGIYDLLGLKTDQKYVVVRFTGRTAVHDMGCRGITLETKRTAVREFARHARVFVSSEEQLPGELESYRIPCPPEHIHHALCYADLLFGDSATMASEAASDMPVFWPVHPRARQKMEEFGFFDQAMKCPNLVLLNPLGYHEMLRMNMDARIMLTDSGGLQEECTVLGTPCLTLRWNTERPITLREHNGASVLVGNDVNRIRAEYRKTLSSARRPVRPALWDGKTAERCLRAILEY